MGPPPNGKVWVRMYRQGFGDCFLLRFPGTNGGSCFVLIDCGVLLGTPGAEETMRNVAENIVSVTNGKLDLVVVTHQHWDHLSGFHDARSIFDNLTIDELWLSWAEDPGDDLACWLKEGHRRTVAALEGFWSALDKQPETQAERHQSLKKRLGHILGFFGIKDGVARGARTLNSSTLDRQ